MIKDFNPTKDILVIPEALNIKTLSKEVQHLVQTWIKSGRVITLKHIYTPAIVRSH
jgi:hypothetical protein